MKELAAALVAAQADMPAIEPNATNPHFKSKFVTLDHLLAKSRPVLKKHGLAVAQFPSIGPGGEPALTTTLLHTSGEHLTHQMLLLPAKGDPQGQGAALTYARRYALAAVLGISSEEDDDGNSAGLPAAQGAYAPKASKVAPAKPAPSKSPGRDSGAGTPSASAERTLAALLPPGVVTGTDAVTRGKADKQQVTALNEIRARLLVEESTLTDQQRRWLETQKFEEQTKARATEMLGKLKRWAEHLPEQAA